MAKSDVTSVQIFKSDAKKIKALTEAVKNDLGSFVSQRMVLMMAVSEKLKSYEGKKK